MSNHKMMDQVNKLARYVQPRYRQDRDEIVEKVKQRVETNTGSYPQIVDASVLRVGDEITIVRSIETLPLWKAVIANIIPDDSPGILDVQIVTEPADRILGKGTDKIPTVMWGKSLGLAALSSDGEDFGESYFAYTNVFLSHTAETLLSEAEPTVIDQPLAPAERTTTLPDGWWGWDV